MLKLKTLLFYGLALIAAISGSKAFALSQDFTIQSEISLGAGIDNLEVINDRFVISLNKTAKSLSILDTWNWRSAGTIALGNTVEAMASNPAGTKLYFAMDSLPGDYIAWMDISSLKTLAFGADITASAFKLTPIPDITYSTVHVSDIAVIQSIDDATVDCIFLKTKDLSSTSANLAFIIFQNSAVLNPGTFLYTSISSVDLSAAQTRLFAISANNTNSYLDGFQCITNQAGSLPLVITDYGLLTLAGTQQFFGIGVEQAGSELAVGETVSKNMWLTQITTTGNLLIANTVDSYLLVKTPSQIWVKDFLSEPNPIVLFAQTASNLYILPTVASGFTTGEPRLVKNFSGSPLLLADSSSTDGFMYVAPKGAASLSVLTANPWIEGLTTSATGIIEGSTFNIQFSYKSLANADYSGCCSSHGGTNGQCNQTSGKIICNDGQDSPTCACQNKNCSYIIADCPNFAVSSAQCGKVVSSGALTASPATFVLNSKEVGGGDHILGVFVADSQSPAHSGRNAIKVSIALPPEINDFKLQFGNQKIIISFKTASVSASTVYKVYYGTNGSAPPDHPEEISNTGGDGTPPSPIEITSPQANHTYSHTIENLVNGQTYYAQIAVTDSQGKVVLSDRKSTVPQLTSTLTDLTGESGGFDCFGNISGAPRPAKGADLVLLAFPLIILLILKFRLRSRR